MNSMRMHSTKRKSCLRPLRPMRRRRNAGSRIGRTGAISPTTRMRWGMSATRFRGAV
ncbi:hypothetical protein EVA_12515 [gut metagenome]|uniref:Uncharacterized protein n=1 Tax=gut metagenome TaxID=749906 RepID=J9GIM3_9ZZZZ